ncbi:MAG: hypothetical protein AAF492_20045, partial [Verrucomicrobiota bacterium]
MAKFMKKRWQQLSGEIRLTLIVSITLVGLGVTFWGSTWLMGADTDNDGMTDEFETLFGLDTNADDARMNQDADHYLNLTESGLNADPFDADTDGDGFFDDEDDFPVSRARIDFGNPRFSLSHGYAFTFPIWVTNDGVEQAGGSWVTTNNRTAWYVATNAAGPASVTVHLDPKAITDGTNEVNLQLKLSYFDHSTTGFSINLLDAQRNRIATGLGTNLITATEAVTQTVVELPLTNFSNEAYLEINWTNSGEVTLYSAQLYIDQDGDFLDLDQEIQLGTRDDTDDTDGDGYRDYVEFLCQSDPTDSNSIPISITTDPPTLVTTTSVTMAGTLHGSDDEYTVILYYGTSDGGTNPGSWGSSTNLGVYDHETAVQISWTLTGLSAEDIRYYRFFADGVTDMWADETVKVITKFDPANYAFSLPI